jgi:hypothetical protein
MKWDMVEINLSYGRLTEINKKTLNKMIVLMYKICKIPRFISLDVDLEAEVESG